MLGSNSGSAQCLRSCAAVSTAVKARSSEAAPRRHRTSSPLSARRAFQVTAPSTPTLSVREGKDLSHRFIVLRGSPTLQAMVVACPRRDSAFGAGFQHLASQRGPLDGRKEGKSNNTVLHLLMHATSLPRRLKLRRVDFIGAERVSQLLSTWMTSGEGSTIWTRAYITDTLQVESCNKLKCQDRTIRRAHKISNSFFRTLRSALRFSERLRRSLNYEELRSTHHLWLQLQALERKGRAGRAVRRSCTAA